MTLMESLYMIIIYKENRLEGMKKGANKNGNKCNLYNILWNKYDRAKLVYVKENGRWDL